MKSFSKFLSEEENLDEVLSRKARFAIGRAARKNAKKNAIIRKRKAKKMASPEDLELRARKKIIKKIKKKMTSDAEGRGEELTIAQKERIEKKIQKLKPKIDRLAKKMLPQVRQAERERLASIRSPEERDDPIK